MSNIDALIAQLCPEGVEFRELGEIGDFYGGLTGKAKQEFKVVKFDHFKPIEFDGFRKQFNYGEIATINNLKLTTYN